MGNKSSTANDNDLVLHPNSKLTRTQDIPVAVGLKIELAKYASTEWQGNTSKAQIIRQVFQ